MNTPKQFAVILHSSGTGYTVRTIFPGEYLPKPYTLAQIVKRYIREKDAQRYADTLNGFRP